MGWSNYIIIDQWKMLIETNRSVQDLEDYIKERLDKIIDGDIDVDISTSDLKVSEITIKDLCVMAMALENTTALNGLEIDKLFLYWLERKNIEYKINSEYAIQIDEYKNKGYNIITR